jgi:hypothetical protein
MSVGSKLAHKVVRAAKHVLKMCIDWRQSGMDRHDIRRIEAQGDETPETAAAPENDWVHELIAMTRPGVEIHFPYRGLGDRVMPFEFDDFS